MKTKSLNLSSSTIKVSIIFFCKIKKIQFFTSGLLNAPRRGRWGQAPGQKYIQSYTPEIKFHDYL